MNNNSPTTSKPDHSRLHLDGWRPYRDGEDLGIAEHRDGELTGKRHPFEVMSQQCTGEFQRDTLFDFLGGLCRLIDTGHDCDHIAIDLEQGYSVTLPTPEQVQLPPGYAWVAQEAEVAHAYTMACQDGTYLRVVRDEFVDELTLSEVLAETNVPEEELAIDTRDAAE